MPNGVNNGSFRSLKMLERKILNRIIIANDSLDSRFRSKDLGVLYKVDIEKAYNHVSLEFYYISEGDVILEKNGNCGCSIVSLPYAFLS